MNFYLKKKISLIVILLFIINLFSYDGLSFFTIQKTKAQDPRINVHVNFQPENSITPAGYIPDVGDVYSYKNGYNYGWNISHKDNTFKRESNYDTLLDTLCKIKTGGVWELEVPNGEYDIEISVGDATYGSKSGTYSISVENTNFFSNIKLQPNEFKSSIKKVVVNDGKVSLSQEATDDGETPINYINISSSNQVNKGAINLQMYNRKNSTYEKSIDPNFKLTNTSENPINLKNLKIRYYYMVGGDTPQNFWCDWSSIGTQYVKGRFVKMEVPMKGADYYVEYTFDENSGFLAKGQTAEIQSRIARSNWNEYDQSDDYSFNAASKNYEEWTKATVYLGDELIWGEEPIEKLPIETDAKVQMYNKHRTDHTNYMSLFFMLSNTGTVQFDLSDVKIRYYYTKEGTQNENFWCDWSSIGEKNVTYNFVTLPKAFTNEKVTNFVDIGFEKNTGNLIVGDSLEIHARIAKTDWSDYVQSNDYSYNDSANKYVDWDKVSVYVKGKLVWGGGVIAETPSKIVTQATEDSISLSWEEIFAAKYYEVEADGVIKNVGLNTNFIDNNLEAGTKHTYRIRAVSDVNTGEWSKTIEKWTIPSIVENISATSTSSSINVSWQPVQGADSYEIEVAGAPVDVGLNTSYIHEGLNANTQRTYRVRAKNSSGYGKWSEIISKSTLPSSSFGISTSATSRSVIILWDKASGATSYDLEIDGVIIPDIIETNYLHSGINPSTEHTYRVRPKNQDGISNWTEIVKVITLPDTPAGLSAKVTGNSIMLTWEVAEGAQGYEVEVDGVVKEVINITSYTYEGLSNNSEHTFRVRAVFNDVKSFWSKSISTATLPGVPLNVNADIVGNTIEITWDLVEGALSYDIEVTGKVINNSNINKFTYKDVKPNTEYTFRVRSVNGAGESEWSENIKKTTLIGIPQNVTAIAAHDSISLEWQAVEGATGYEVLADGEIRDVTTDTYFAHKGLKPNTLHVYRVRAKSGDSSSEWTAPIVKSTIQGVPGNLRTTITSNNIILIWDAVSGATSYEVKADGAIFNINSGNIFIHDGLSPNSEHTYSVRSKKDGVVSPWSNEIKVKTAPGIPKGLKAIADETYITLSWISANGASSYDIEVDGRILTGYDAMEYIHDGLESNTKHSYRVRARSESGVSEWSERLDKLTKPVMQINAGKDNMFNFVFVVPMRWDIPTRTITVKYNPDELEVIDLCSVTPTLESGIGKIDGTDITVASYKPGEIIYKITGTSQTLVNSIRFMAKVNGHSKVVYTVE